MNFLRIVKMPATLHNTSFICENPLMVNLCLKYRYYDMSPSLVRTIEELLE
jgi:hypothetical protein